MYNVKTRTKTNKIVVTMAEYKHITQKDLVEQGWWFPRDVKGVHIKFEKMKMQDLAKQNEVLVKPKGFMNYYPMEVTKAQEGFTISNYGNELIGGHEFLYHVKNQSDLDKLNVSF